MGTLSAWASVPFLNRKPISPNRLSWSSQLSEQVQYSGLKEPGSLRSVVPELNSMTGDAPVIPSCGCSARRAIQASIAIAVAILLYLYQNGAQNGMHLVESPASRATRPLRSRPARTRRPRTSNNSSAKPNPVAASKPPAILFLPAFQNHVHDVNEYATFIPRTVGLPSPSAKRPPGLIEETSRAYVLQSRAGGRKDSVSALEFAPGGECKLTHPEHWAPCAPPAVPLQRTPPGFKFTHAVRTAWGEDAWNFSQRVLREAWEVDGAAPPHIDAVIRTGALAAFELSALLESLALFWPAVLGEVVIVLDSADRRRREEVVPARFAAALRLRVVYEPTPCLPGRIWNQISNPILADWYSEAPIIAFFDSDVVLTAPVTPDRLFSGGWEALGCD